MSQEYRNATFGESALVFLFMIVTIIVGNIFLGIKIEILLLISTAFALIMAKRLGYTWNDMEKEICTRMSSSTPAILIIWTIGVVIASFMFSGSIPMVIYYGLRVIDPRYMYICSFGLCGILSLCTGTSWGSAATGGVAMMGIATGFGLPAHITAAAVICGSLIGDKLSPLSDTTNLAPLAAGTDLYAHIRSMLWTTVPASIVTGLIYYVLGLNTAITDTALPQSAVNMISDLDNIYKWGFVVLVPFIVIFLGAIFRLPTVPCMLFASGLAVVIGGGYQGFNIVEGLNSCINGFTVDLIYGESVSGEILTLLNRGGMKSMVGIVVIVYCGYAFATVVSKAGFLETLTAPLVRSAKTPVSLIIVTMITNFFISACAGSIYAAFIITGEMYRDAYEKMGLDPTTLSRTMEDSGTMMMPLVPWGVAGTFYAATLGVPVLGANGYALWSFNTVLNPLMAILLAVLGISIYKGKAIEKKTKA